jgi:hypothetical protein
MTFLDSGAAQESNLPTHGLHALADFEARTGSAQPSGSGAVCAPDGAPRAGWQAARPCTSRESEERGEHTLHAHAVVLWVVMRCRGCGHQVLLPNWLGECARCQRDRHRPGASTSAPSYLPLLFNPERALPSDGA